MKTRAVKIAFDLGPDEWHGYSVETVWAEDLGAGNYRLRNSPFYAFNYSAEDIVAAEERDGRFFATSTVRPGGHSTYRIIKDPATTESEFGAYWAGLAALGCTYEGGPGNLVSVDVPPTASLARVSSLLDAGIAAGVWDAEEGHRGRPN